jgi:hypothetical protein
MHTTGRMARHIVPQPAAQAGLDRHRLVDSIARSDAHADGTAGGEGCYQAMEQLFAGGDITQAAWERYCSGYEAACARQQATG